MKKDGTVRIEMPDGAFVCELPDVGEPEKWRLTTTIYGEVVAAHPNHKPIFMAPFLDALEKEKNSG